MPCIRTRATQTMLVAMDEYRSGLNAAVRASLATSAMASIDATLPTSWLPFPLARLPMDAALNRLGPEHAESFCRYYFCHHYAKSPRMRAFIEGAIRLLGLTPAALLKSLPRAWSGTFRNMGEIETSVKPGWAEILVTGIPPMVLDCPNHFVVLAGVFGAVYDITKTPGEISHARRYDVHMVQYSLRW